MYVWTCIRRLDSEIDFDNYRDIVMCCSAIYHKENKALCDVCGGDHVGEERRIQCISARCGPRKTCPVVWKIRHCVAHDVWLVFVNQASHGRGAQPCLEEHPARVTAAMKAFIASQDIGQVPPRVIKTSLESHPYITQPYRGWPSIEQIYSALKRIRANEGDRNTLEAVRAFVATRIYSVDSELSPNRAIVFGPNMDSNGHPSVGSGYDNDPFILGVTSPRLVDNIARYASSVKYRLFHSDATFKLSDIAYPVITCGYTDKARSYQVAALFVVSQRTAAVHRNCFQSLSDLVWRLRGKAIGADAFMGDADRAQLGGVRDVPAFASVTPLMCYFHVLFNVRNQTKHFDEATRRVVMRGVLDMHFSRSLDEFKATRDLELRRWRAVPALVGFADRFEEQWLTEPFWRWQIFHTPGGYAATNNPCEVYNSSMKSYTQRRRFHMTRLLLKLCHLVEDHVPAPPVADDYVPVPTADIVAAAKAMIASGRTTIQRSSAGSTVRIRYVSNYNDDPTSDPSAFSSVFDKASDIAETVARTRDDGAKTDARKKKAAKMYKRAISWSLWRFHNQGMPETGWLVDFEKATCECKYFAKFHICAHLLIAQHRDDLNAIGVRMKLLDRSRRRFQNTQQGTVPVRQPHSQPLHLPVPPHSEHPLRHPYPPHQQQQHSYSHHHQQLFHHQQQQQLLHYQQQQQFPYPATAHQWQHQPYQLHVHQLQTDAYHFDQLQPLPRATPYYALPCPLPDLTHRPVNEHAPHSHRSDARFDRHDTQLQDQHLPGLHRFSPPREQHENTPQSQALLQSGGDREVQQQAPDRWDWEAVCRPRAVNRGLQPGDLQFQPSAMNLFDSPVVAAFPTWLEPRRGRPAHASSALEF